VSTKINIVEADAIKRLRTLARWFEREPFTYIEAARALKLMRKAARNHVLNMASRGWLKRAADRGLHSQYALTDHEEAKAALEWAERRKQ
jgi:predicted ArsR family transcriptional regulator